MGYCNVEETNTKTKCKGNKEEAKHKMYEVSMGTSPQNKYLIINIFNNTLITHLTSFKNNPQSKDLTFNGGLSQNY